MDHKTAKKVARVLAVLLVVAMIITSFAFVPGMFASAGHVVYAAESQQGNTDAYLKSQMLTLEQMMKEIQTNYKDEVTYQTLVDGAFRGVFESLEEPFSVYYKTAEEGDAFYDSANGQYSGIGVSIQDDNGLCRVVSPISGGPAEKAGIRSGDIITEIDGVSLKGKTISDASTMMRGVAGTKVTLKVQRNGSSLSFTLTREKLRETTVTGKMLDNHLGYLQITQFGSNTHLEFKAEKLKLLNQGATSLILDVRGNPGGVMDAAANIAQQLMPAGPIFHYAQQGKIVETVTAKGVAGKAVPMVLLINEGTASAAECLAGALQDSKTATLVGTTSYGKGIAQQMANLPNGASFKLSTHYFLTPDKHEINHVGIAPDYVVYNGLGLTREQINQIYSELAPMSEKTKYKAGETGLNVYAAQQRLVLLGFDVEVTGTMDTKTVAAIKSFQREQGFSAYGGLDYTTINALDKVISDYLTGGKEDKQLAKAVELLAK